MSGRPGFPQEEETLRAALEDERALAVALADYAGQWVAVRNHKVVLSAATLADLRDLMVTYPDHMAIEGLFLVPETDAPFFFAALVASGPTDTPEPCPAAITPDECCGDVEACKAALGSRSALGSESDDSVAGASE